MALLVRLRLVTSADADALFALHSSTHVLRYWDSPPWRERARADRFITACRQMAEEGSGARLAIDRVCDGAFLGWCSLTRWNPDHRSASLGYCLGDAAWGHGYATEAARTLLQWAFDSLDLNRVQAETDTRNVASARVLEKLGFLREGTLREDCVVDGEVSDSWVYGLIRRQWRPTDGWPWPGDGRSTSLSMRGGAMSAFTAPFAVQPGEGTVLRTPTGDRVTIKANTQKTNGALTVLELVIAPKSGPALHTHLREDELWYVLEGEFRFQDR